MSPSFQATPGLPVFRIGNKSHIRPADKETLDLDPRGIVWIYEPPITRAKYVMGVDPTFGKPQWNRFNRTEDDHVVDNGAIEIIRVGRGEPGKEGFRPDVQVCEYAAPVDPYDLAAIANALGRLYAG